MSARRETLSAWRREIIDRLRRDANDLRTAAARQDALALKIEHPPEGVTVERGHRDTVLFVGPLSLAVSLPSPAEHEQGHR